MRLLVCIRNTCTYKGLHSFSAKGQGFHEACVEKIHADIRRRCGVDKLEVSARFTRRGGLDINPVRSTHPGPWTNRRDPRQ